MKTALLYSLIFSAAAQAQTPALNCYKAAAADPNVGQALKTWCASVATFDNCTEDFLTRLCAGAPSASAPIECFKAGMADASILPALKAEYRTQAFLYEKPMALLCSQSPSGQAPLNCFREATKDPLILPGAKQYRKTYPNDNVDELDQAIINLCRTKP